MCRKTTNVRETLPMEMVCNSRLSDDVPLILRVQRKQPPRVLVRMSSVSIKLYRFLVPYTGPPPNTRLQRTPLRVERDRAFFSVSFCYNGLAIYQ